MGLSNLRNAPEGPEYPKPPTRAKRQIVKKLRKDYHPPNIRLTDFVQQQILPNEYRYTPLNPGEDVIRLLRLQAGKGDERLHCSFEVVSLAKGATRPGYEALSYCWGTDEPSKLIRINDDPDNKFYRDRGSLTSVVQSKFLGLSFNIRDNLHEALKHFRESGQDVMLWELAFAHDATLHYANMSVYWTEFANTVALFVNRIEEIKARYRTRSEFNHEREPLGDVTALGASILVDVTRNSFRKRKWDTEDRYLEPLSGLEALMSNLLSFGATDPRDTVYALLSIMKENNDGRSIKADYQKTAIEVYRDFTKFCVERSTSVDIICRHWAPAKKRPSASIRSKRTKDTKNGLIAKIPSWVPTLAGSPFGDPEAALNAYNASRSKPASFRSEDYPISPISDASGTKEPASPKTQNGFVDGIADPLLPKDKPHINHVFYMYVKGFKVDIITKVSARIAGGLLVRECLTMGDWEEPDDQSTNNVPDKLWRTLVADRGPNGENTPTWHQRACSECFARSTTSGNIDTGALIANHKLPSEIRDFSRRVQSLVWNRVFVTTQDKKHFGLAPKATRAGDGTLEHYELIGETYIYELMDGEALDIQDSPPYEDFKLG
ncbi:MAG: hypothetical protein L6R37_003068 [Teloschistes peruensis]|nr:MAG: hypothetical protein L6R37_003068 [Teloschistes peruensis]